MRSSISSSRSTPPDRGEPAGASDPGLLRSFMVSALVVLLGIAALSEWILRRHVIPQDSFPSHVALYHSAKGGDFAFGDSHTARGFDAQGTMVNLAYPSEGITHMSWKIRDVFAERTPGLVIVQADPHLFAPYRLRRSVEDLATLYTLNGDTRLAQIFDPRHRPLLKSYLLRYLATGGNLQSRIVRTQNGALLSPGQLDEKSDRAVLFEARDRLQLHRPDIDPFLREAKMGYREMLDYLRNKQARICMVSYPVSPAYRRTLAQDIDRQSATQFRDVMAFLETEARRVGARYVDHRAIFDDPSLFRDVDHLNADGARRYRDVLMSACAGQQ